jgi:hypothetical protein
VSTFQSGSTSGEYLSVSLPPGEGCESGWIPDHSSCRIRIRIWNSDPVPGLGVKSARLYAVLSDAFVCVPETSSSICDKEKIAPK